MVERANAGNANAQGTLGAAYAMGKSVPQDDVEAVKWYRKAAEQGYAVRATQPWFRRTPTGKGDCRRTMLKR